MNNMNAKPMPMADRASTSPPPNTAPLAARGVSAKAAPIAAKVAAKAGPAIRAAAKSAPMNAKKFASAIVRGRR